MKYNPNEVNCVECGTVNDAGRTSCEYCETEFKTKKRYRVPCYYCSKPIDAMWGSAKAEIKKDYDLIYMLCDANHDDTTPEEGTFTNTIGE